MDKSPINQALLTEIESGSVVCPTCKGALSWLDLEARLTCLACSTEFRVENGIPVFSDTQSMDAFKLTESMFHSSIATEASDAHCSSTLRVRTMHENILHPVLSATSEGSRILEIAIGPGHDMNMLLSHGRMVFGIDIAYAMCSEAARFTGESGFRDRSVIVQGDAEALPFSDNQFEAVVCVASLHHFSQPQEALDEINRVLLPGGIASIGSEPNCWPYMFKRLKHSTIGKRFLRLLRDDYTIEGGSIADFETQGFRETDLRRLGEGAGFQVILIRPAWYTTGFLSLLGLRPPEVLEKLSIRLDDVIAGIPGARRFPWKWNMVLRKS